MIIENSFKVFKSKFLNIFFIFNLIFIYVVAKEIFLFIHCIIKNLLF